MKTPAQTLYEQGTRCSCDDDVDCYDAKCDWCQAMTPDEQRVWSRGEGKAELLRTWDVSEAGLAPAEGCKYPWWVVIDPAPIKGYRGRTNAQRVEAAADAVVGPFLSRASADEHLQAKRHRYSPHAVVYCMSGYHSPDWRQFCEGKKP